MHTPPPRLIEPAQLAEHLSNPDLIIIDLSSASQYALAHVPGAIHVEPGELVHGAPPAPGMLPDAPRLQALLQRIGLKDSSHVVAMDDEGGGWAGRMLWTLACVGHDRWSYLNGGLPAWLSAGQAATAEVPSPQPSKFTINLETLEGAPRIRLEALRQTVGDGTTQVWDCRSIGEYLGADVRAARGGHIPGARHLDWLDLMDPERALRIPEDVESRIARAGIDHTQRVVVHCQSHHRSALAWLVGTLLGFREIVAYDGSWSEWGNHPDTPIEVGPPSV